MAKSHNQRGDRHEFGPSADLMRMVTVDVVFHLAGKQRRLRVPLDVYYRELEPVLARIEKEQS